MVNGALKMTHVYKAICGALLLIGLVNIVPTPASAGTYYDSVCNCRRPDSEYNTRRFERAPARVINHERTIVKDVELHKVNTTNKVREEFRHETVNRFAQGETRHVLERREVRGVNCNCADDGRSRGGDDGERVSYRY
jgi:hypothetical protein